MVNYEVLWRDVEGRLKTKICFSGEDASRFIDLLFCTSNLKRESVKFRQIGDKWNKQS
jgi:hypothetical protein